MAWISARHPRTFRGSLRRSSSFLPRECLADFRLPREFWSWRMESAHRFVFCLIAMLRHSSKSDANGAMHDITSSLQDSYAYRLRFFDRGIDYYLPVFGNPSSHFGFPLRASRAPIFSRLFQSSAFCAEELARAIARRPPRLRTMSGAPNASVIKFVTTTCRTGPRAKTRPSRSKRAPEKQGRISST